MKQLGRIIAVKFARSSFDYKLFQRSFTPLVAFSGILCLNFARLVWCFALLFVFQGKQCRQSFKSVRSKFFELSSNMGSLIGFSSTLRKFYVHILLYHEKKYFSWRKSLSRRCGKSFFQNFLENKSHNWITRTMHCRVHQEMNLLTNFRQKQILWIDAEFIFLNIMLNAADRIARA